VRSDDMPALKLLGDVIAWRRAFAEAVREGYELETFLQGLDEAEFQLDKFDREHGYQRPRPGATDGMAGNFSHFRIYQTGERARE
jgi:hypothetical protein